MRSSEDRLRTGSNGMRDGPVLLPNAKGFIRIAIRDILGDWWKPSIERGI